MNKISLANRHGKVTLEYIKGHDYNVIMVQQDNAAILLEPDMANTLAIMIMEMVKREGSS